MRRIFCIVMVLVLITASMAGASGPENARGTTNRKYKTHNVPMLSQETMDELSQFSGVPFKVGDLSPNTRTLVKAYLDQASGIPTFDEDYIRFLPARVATISYAHFTASEKAELKAKGKSVKFSDLSTNTVTANP